MKKLTDLLFILYGIISITSQTIFIRELMIVFGGNELSIGITFFSWLFGTALGSFIFSKTFNFKNIKLTSSTLFILLSFILPLSLIFIRSIRILLNVQTTELIGIFSTAGLSFLILFPFCFFSGSLFPALSKLYHQFIGLDVKRSVGRVYIFEGIGALTGGLLLNFFFIKYLLNFQICSIICFLCLLAVILILLIEKRIFTVLLNIGIFSLIYFSFINNHFNKIEKTSLNLLWKGYQVLSSKNTVYGNIVVLEESLQRSFYENGVIIFSSSDIMNAEESVHFALLEHPDPKNILLLGGGINGGINQALKHKSIKEIDYVELDPAIIEIGRKYLSKEDLPPFNNKNINIYNVDARFFIKRCPKKYDVIIANFPDPSNAQINRFFTLEFFQEISNVLNEGGVFSFRLSSSENYINNTLAQFFKSIETTLKNVFNDIIIIPGNTLTFVASNQKGTITNNPDILIKRIKERSLNLLYVSEIFLPFRMSKERIDYTNSVISNAPSSEINKDFKPIGYYYNIVLWSSYFSEKVRDLFTFIYNLKYRNFFIFLFLMILLIPFMFLKKKRNIVSVVYIMGFSMICFEVMIILGFQILYGYIYSKISIIIAGFMGGLALGGWAPLKIIHNKEKTFSLLKKIQLSISIMSIIIAISFFALSNIESILIFGVTEIYLFLLIFISGFLGGCHFQLSNALYIEENSEKDWGVIYSADLFGSCIGALLLSTFIIPISGIFVSCIYLTVLNLVGFVILKIYKFI
jgi:spermidine synthase